MINLSNADYKYFLKLLHSFCLTAHLIEPIIIVGGRLHSVWRIESLKKIEIINCANLSILFGNTWQKMTSWIKSRRRELAIEEGYLGQITQIYNNLVTQPRAWNLITEYLSYTYKLFVKCLYFLTIISYSLCVCFPSESDI